MSVVRVELPSGEVMPAKGTSGQAVHIAEQAPPYDQYDVTDLGSKAATSATVVFDASWPFLYKRTRGTLFVTVTGGGTATLWVDVSRGGGVWYRWNTSLAAGLTSASGVGGLVAVAIPDGLWGLELRPVIQETAGVATTFAIWAGGHSG